MNTMLMGAKVKKDPKADHYQTPPEILEAVNAFYEGKWFDPCPANPTFDGLVIPWPPGTYINPPFSQNKEWSLHALSQPYEQIWMCHHNHDAMWFQMREPDALCLLSDRVVFIDPETGKPKVDEKGRPQTAIGKCQTLMYCGFDTSRFKKHFEHLGLIVETV